MLPYNRFFADPFPPWVTEACISPNALRRQNDAVKVVAVLDILTDAMRKFTFRLPFAKLI